MEERDEYINEHNGKWMGETWVFHLRLPKARKTYHCNVCEHPIEKGTRHVKYVTAGQEGPGMETWRLHGECYIDGQSRCIAEDRPNWRWVGTQASKYKGKRRRRLFE